MNTGFELLFNRIIIYDTLFWGLKTVSEYPNLETLKIEDEKKYNLWVEFIKKNFGEHNITDANYHTYAPLYGEFSKIISIGYATIEINNNKINRKFKIISENNEKETINKFLDVFSHYESIGNSTNPKFEFTMCGYDIINYDIPVFIKRFLKYFIDEENKRIPNMLKNYLSSKPWNSNIINIKTLYNMNSSLPFMNFDIMVNNMELKQAENLINTSDISKYYWENIERDHKTTIKNINYSLGNLINTNIQFMNKFRFV